MSFSDKNIHFVDKNSFFGDKLYTIFLDEYDKVYSVDIEPHGASCRFLTCQYCNPNHVLKIRTTKGHFVIFFIHSSDREFCSVSEDHKELRVYGKWTKLHMLNGTVDYVSNYFPIEFGLTEPSTTITCQFESAAEKHAGSVEIFVNFLDLLNLRAIGPFIYSNETWVGYGYEQTDVNGDRCQWTSMGQEVGLYYTDGQNILASQNYRGQSVPKIASQVMENYPTTKGSYGSQPNIVNPKWEIPVSTLPIPPPAATHLATIVDINNVIEETTKDDNRSNPHLPLPDWDRRIEWTSASDITVDVTSYASRDQSESRNVNPIRIGVKVHEYIWGRWVAAREHYFLKVFVKPQDKDQRYRGWVFQTQFESNIHGKKPIPGKYMDQDVLFPMNGFNEEKMPKGANDSESPYLYVHLHGIDLTTGEVNFIYLPPTEAGEDRIQVQLCRWNRDQSITTYQSIEMTVNINERYSLELVDGFEEYVDPTIFTDTRRPVESQIERHLVPQRLSVQALLNGRPVPPGYILRIRWTGKRKNGKARMPGWILPQSYERTLLRAQSRPLVIRRDKKAGVAAINETRGQGIDPYTGSAKRQIELTFDAQGRAEFFYLGPMAGGIDSLEFALDRANNKKPQSIAGPPLKHEFKIRSVWLPVFFVPGILASRLTIMQNEGNVSWDPEDRQYMFSKWVAPSVSFETIQQTLDATNPGAVLTTHPLIHNKEYLWRGFAEGVWEMYQPLLESWAINPYQESELVHLSIHQIGYDWRMNNEDSATFLAGQVNTKLTIDSRLIEQSHEGKDGFLISQKIILITHSMGGLVTRMALLKDQSLRDRTMGVIHIFQPVCGAAVFYSRFFTGAVNPETVVDLVSNMSGEHLQQYFDNWSYGQVAGNTRSSFGRILSGVTSAFQLAPNSHYDANGEGWLIDQSANKTIKGEEVWETYTQNDPYGNPPGLVNAGKYDSADKADIQKKIAKNIEMAKSFHDKLGMYQLPTRTWNIAGTGLDTVTRIRIPPPPDTPPIVDVVGNHSDRGNDIEIIYEGGDETVPLISSTALSPTAGVPVGTPASETNRLWIVNNVVHSMPFKGGDVQRCIHSIMQYIFEGR